MLDCIDSNNFFFQYPQDFGGATLISTPSIFYNWFPNSRGGVSGFGQAPATTARPGGDNGGGGGGGFGGFGGGGGWGRGHRLND